MDMQATGLVGMVHPYQDRTDTWLDRDALVTVFSRQAVRDGSYRMEQTVRFEPECQRFERHKNRLHENRKTEHAGRLSPDSLDLYGALYYLRTQPLEVDKTYELTLFAGDAAVAVRAHVQRKERLRVPAGSFECFLISLSADAPAASKVKEVKWWLSVDDQHIPVRVRTKIGIGHITADLAVSPVKRSD
jgi:hypothetical protein